jgi:ABC-type multidrug transport system ATPase subunit
MSPSATYFQARDLTLRRGNRLVWDRAQWTLEGTTAIVGANGSGKSSTLKMLAGQLAPDEGSLSLNVKGYQREEANWMTCCSLAAPWAGIPRHLNLREALNFHGHFRTSRVEGLGWDALLTSSGLNVDPSLSLSHWSSGQQQRLHVALALGTDVDVVLLDEPTSNLDAEGISWVQHAMGVLAPTVMLVVATNNPTQESPQGASFLEL